MSGDRIETQSAMILAGSLWKWAQGLGGPGLILLGIADNTPFVSAPPGSMDIALILLAAHQTHWWAWLALMATVGEVLGGYLTYRLSERGGLETFEKKPGHNRAEKLYKLFETHGGIAIFVGSLLPPPFPFTSVLMTAGVMQYPRSKFFVVLAAGRTVRFFVESWCARVYSRQMLAWLARYYRPLLWLIIVLAVIAGVGEVIHYRRRIAGRSQKQVSTSDTPILSTTKNRPHSSV